jgi:hypothetical protein
MRPNMYAQCANAKAFYDKDMIELWKANTPRLDDLIDFRPLPRGYKSNWRILHIDGFEARTLQFFKPTKMAEFDVKTTIEN